QTGLLPGEFFRPATPSDQVPGDGGTQVVLAAGDRDETVEDVLHGVFFEHKSLHAEIDGAIERLLLLIHRENDDLRGQSFALQLARNLQAGQAGQVDVEHGDIGLFLEYQLKRHPAVSGLANELKSRVGLYHLAQPLAEQRMVIDDQNFDSSGHDLRILSDVSGNSVAEFGA